MPPFRETRENHVDEETEEHLSGLRKRIKNIFLLSSLWLFKNTRTTLSWTDMSELLFLFSAEIGVESREIEVRARLSVLPFYLFLHRLILLLLIFYAMLYIHNLFCPKQKWTIGGWWWVEDEAASILLSISLPPEECSAFRSWHLHEEQNDRKNVIWWFPFSLHSSEIASLFRSKPKKFCRNASEDEDNRRGRKKLKKKNSILNWIFRFIKTGSLTGSSPCPLLPIFFSSLYEMEKVCFKKAPLLPFSFCTFTFL